MREGDAAELLSRRVLLAMQAGTYDELRDSALLKQSYSRELVGIHVGELNEWLLSGVLRGQEITPPHAQTTVEGQGTLAVMNWLSCKSA